jgi:hypothetical protein
MTTKVIKEGNENEKKFQNHQWRSYKREIVAKLTMDNMKKRRAIKINSIEKKERNHI